MEYLVTHFRIQSPEALFQTVRDLLADAVTPAGFESFVNTPAGIDGYVQEQRFDETELIRDLQTLPVKGVNISYQTRRIEDKDWNKDWEDSGFEPITVDDTILIYDARHHRDPHPGISSDHIEIGIDAIQAFGTGTHTTTRMMLSTLLQMDLNGKRVLDCGCGTGILGIAALKMGAEEAVGYDIDDWSVRNARHNAEINGIRNLKVLQGDSGILRKINEKFDCVLANIHRNILLQDMPVFKSVMKAGGVLAISGFYLSDIPVLLRKASQSGLERERQRNDGEWACLSFRLP
nr:50S ribosomal protein L11 methyltransferase [Prevotella sp. UBA5379]